MQPDGKKLCGLFINTAKAEYLISDSGHRLYESLRSSNIFTLNYLEIDKYNRRIPGNYDFYVFTYERRSMGWLDTGSLHRLPGLKIAFVLEPFPDSQPGSYPPGGFDAYCVFDRMADYLGKNVYYFPRPLDIPAKITSYRVPKVPVIGSYGIAAPGQGFELLVDAVNREFEEAVIRINISPGPYPVDYFRSLHNRNYIEYISDLCKKVAKNGVEVSITADYMDNARLTEWCSQNTLNCFFYNLIPPGFSDTADQALASGRPVAISSNDTFHSIHPHIKPYPFRSLRESIQKSQSEVIEIQKIWTRANFIRTFENILQTVEIADNSKPLKVITLKKKISPPAVISTAVSWIPIQVRKHFLSTSKDEMKGQINQTEKISEEGKKDLILIISHKEQQCGIYQYALNITEALKKSVRYNFMYAECSDELELNETIIRMNPAVIIYNYYPATMPWLTPAITRRYSIPQLGIMHEVTQEEADRADRTMFDFHLCPDPTLIENNPIVFRTKRLLPPYTNTQKLPEVVTIGSFGFGFGDKGFERIIETVQNEFDRARIRLHLPFNDIVDKKGKIHTLSVAKRCRRLVTKPGIELTISHDFLDKKELFDFLASNTLNAFFYDTGKHLGISSTIEHALAVQRPMAITKCGMFRHVISANPSICIENSSLRQIIDNGIAPLVPFYNDWSEASFIMDYERIIDEVLGVR